MKGKLLIQKEVNNHKGTDEFAGDIVKYLKKGDIVLFYGKLGAGKTYIIKKIVTFLGAEVEASSPSFAIINQYEGRFRINHMDFYRIENKRELYNLGLDELFTSDAVNLVEWPEIIQDFITWPHYRIFIKRPKDKESARSFNFYHYNE